MTPPAETQVLLSDALDAVWAVRRGYETAEASHKGRQACDRIATELRRLAATQGPVR